MTAAERRDAAAAWEARRLARAEQERARRARPRKRFRTIGLRADLYRTVVRMAQERGVPASRLMDEILLAAVGGESPRTAASSGEDGGGCRT